MKRDCFLHPLFTSAWWVGMYVHSFGHFGIRFSRHHPSWIVKLVSTVVCGHYVHKHNVFSFFIQARDAYLERRKHPSEVTKRETKQISNQICSLIYFAQFSFELRFGEQLQCACLRVHVVYIKCIYMSYIICLSNWFWYKVYEDTMWLVRMKLYKHLQINTKVAYG